MTKTKIISYIEKGNSFPIIIERVGKKYFVKLREGMSGGHALLNEWFGNRLGNLLGLNTQEPIWINLEKEIDFGNIHIEVKELVSKSLGLNIGFIYQENIIALVDEDLLKLKKEELNEIFLLDLLMINIDRTRKNSNLLWLDKQLIATDYESSLIFHELLSGKNLFDDTRILKQLKANPLYQEMDSKTINRFLKKLNSLFFEKILNEIPHSILNEKNKEIILRGIHQRKKNAWYIEEILAQLNPVKIESEKENLIRIKKNREAFESFVRKKN